MRKPIMKLNEEEYAFRDRYNNYMAFMTRCKIHQMNISHKNQARFPYNAEELAIYMHYLLDHMKPVVEEEYMSN